MAFNFDPISGLNDKTVFPTAPTSEAAARQQFMTLFNQIKDYLNSNTIDAATLGGKKNTDFLLNDTANQKFSLLGHTHDYAAASHTHTPSNCGFSWGTSDPNNSDGKANGTIYYRIEG